MGERQDESSTLMRVKRGAGVLALLASVTVAAVALVGCERAVSKPAPEEAMEPAAPTPTPTPTLQGTWERTTYERDGSGNILSTHTTKLTFTETHYLERDERKDANGTTIDAGNSAGLVSVAGDTVTKTYFDDESPMEVPKDFLLTGNSLFIHHWSSDHLEDSYDQFTRVGGVPIPGTSSTLQGTWQIRYVWDEDDGVMHEELKTLTFAGSRAIEHILKTVTRSGQAEVENEWDNSVGWSTAGSIITRTFIDDEQQKRSVDKEYVLVDNLLAVHDWTDEEVTNRFAVYTRVQDPLPGGLTGTWKGWNRWCEPGDMFDESDEAEIISACRQRMPWTFSFGETFTEQYLSLPGASPVVTFDLTGSWRQDPENHFVFVTVQEVAETTDGSPEDFPWVGDELRYAYAPSGVPGQLVFSPFGSEREYDEATSTWKEREDRPYGGYWMRLERQN